MSQIPVNIQFDKVVATETIKNWKLIRPVIESILFWGRQRLASTRYNDFGSLSIQEPIENVGNFRGILRYGLKMTSIKKFWFTVYKRTL